MKARTLVTQRLYFGLKAIDLRAATGRVLSRVVGLPPERARASARHLRQDFGVDTVQANTLVEQLVAEGLLEPPGELQADYGGTARFVEYASPRVTEPPPLEHHRQPP